MSARRAIDVPFLCHWRRAVEVTDEHPYREMRQYLVDPPGPRGAAFATLAYFDGHELRLPGHGPGAVLGRLMDEICPPSTVFAAYNHYAGPHEIRVWPFNGHEGGEVDQQAERYAFLAGLGVAP